MSHEGTKIDLIMKHKIHELIYGQKDGFDLLPITEQSTQSTSAAENVSMRPLGGGCGDLVFHSTGSSFSVIPSS